MLLLKTRFSGFGKSKPTFRVRHSHNTVFFSVDCAILQTFMSLLFNFLSFSHCFVNMQDIDGKFLMTTFVHLTFAAPIRRWTPMELKFLEKQLRWVDASTKLQTDQTSTAIVAHFEREVTATDQDMCMGSDKAVKLEFTSHPTDISHTMNIVCGVKVN